MTRVLLFVFVHLAHNILNRVYSLLSRMSLIKASSSTDSQTYTLDPLYSSLYSQPHTYLQLKMPRPRKSEEEKRQANALRQTRFRERKRAEAVAADHNEAEAVGPAPVDPGPVEVEAQREIVVESDEDNTDEQHEPVLNESFRQEDLDAEDSEDGSASNLQRLHQEKRSSSASVDSAPPSPLHENQTVDDLALMMGNVAVTEHREVLELPLHVDDTYAWEDNSSNDSSSLRSIQSDNPNDQDDNPDDQDDVDVNDEVSSVNEADELPLANSSSQSSELYEPVANIEQDVPEPRRSLSEPPTIEQSAEPAVEIEDNESEEGSDDEDDSISEESGGQNTSNDSGSNNEEMVDMDNRVIDLLQDAWDPFCHCGE